MSSFGVVPSGFAAKDSDEVLSDLQDDLRDNINSGLADQAGQPDSLIGQITGVQTVALAEIWEVLEALYNATDPATATGAALDAIGALRGVTRDPPSKSAVTLTVTLNAFTTLPAGNVVSHVADETVRFVTIADVTSTSSGNYTVAAEAEFSGPISAGIGTLTVIDTPYTGWTAVTNAAVAIAGTNRETDEDYRARMDGLFSVAAGGTIDAIRAELILDAEIAQARVFANNTDITDADSVPPHAIEAVVYGTFTTDGSAAGIADRNRIAQILFDSVGAGIGTYGNFSGTAEDAEGNEYTLYFSTPDTLAVSVTAVVTTNDEFPADGIDQIEDAIATYFAALQLGEDVIRTQLYGVIFAISGVTDVTTLTLNGGTSNITTTAREIATLNVLSVS